MRKNLLVLAAMAFVSLSAVALPQPNPDWQIIDEQPEGELALYSRTCQALREMYGEVEKIVEEGSVVKIIEASDGSVWIGNPISMFNAPGWLKAEKSDEYLTITGPQLVYEEYDWDLDDGSYLKYYVTAVEPYEYENENGEKMKGYRPTEDGVFRFAINGTTYKEDGDGSLILGICAYNEANGYFFTGYGDQYTILSLPDITPVEVPATATVNTGWAMRYYDAYDYENAHFVDVAIDGDDYYVRGINTALPDAWVKGTKSGDRIVFPNFQPFGADLEWNYFVYLAGGSLNLFGDEMTAENAILDEEGFVMTIGEDGLLEAENFLFFVTSPDTNPENANYLSYFTNVEIKEQDPSTFTNPVGPDDIYLGGIDGAPAIEFNLPPLDENGNLLDVKNLYFSAYANSKIVTFDPDVYYDMMEMGLFEPTTELPYDLPDNGYDFYQAGASHTVYLYVSEELYNIGIQAIYYPEGRDVNPDNVLKSDIIMVGEDPNSVLDIMADKEVAGISYWNLDGRRVNADAPGIYLKRVDFADGSVKTVKIIRK